MSKSIVKLPTKKASTKKSKSNVKRKVRSSARSLPGSTEGKVWEDWQLSSERWQSDLKFFEDEIRFLHSLISKYFLLLAAEENIMRVKSMEKELRTLEEERKKFEQTIVLHQQHYRGLVENPFAHDSHGLKKEHDRLEQEIASFVMRFKKLKLEMFELTERMLESEKARHMLIEK